MKPQPWLFEKEDSIRLLVKIKANAPKNALKGVKQDRLEIAITAQREKGKANAALIAFIAECLNTAKSNVVILKGETLPLKEIALYNVTYIFCHKCLTNFEDSR